MSPRWRTDLKSLHDDDCIGVGRVERRPARPVGPISDPSGERRITAEYAGLEPATSGVTGRCSNQLSYIPGPKRTQSVRQRFLIMRTPRDVSRVGVAARYRRRLILHLIRKRSNPRLWSWCLSGV